MFGRFTFAHNGTVACFFEIRTALLALISPAARRCLLGTTDSEHAAALFVTHLDPLGPWTKSYPVAEIRTALRKTVEDLHSLVEKIGRPEHERSFLNFVVTDGR